MSLSFKFHSRSHPTIFLAAIERIDSFKILSHVAFGILTVIIALPIAFAFSYISTSAGDIFEAKYGKKFRY
jgi:hypothetical protein